MSNPFPAAFDFSIPSSYDETELECRLYIPTSLREAEAGSVPWQSKGAIVGHPYAPMGGCQDDPIVLCIVEQLVSQQFVVGTFNFRGAGNTKARTSWTAKPETEDFESVVGLIVNLLQNLQTQENGQGPTVTRPPISLLLSGYSYGSLVTRLLPHPDSFLNKYASLESASVTAKIRLQAKYLARSILKKSHSTLLGADGLNQGASSRTSHPGNRVAKGAGEHGLSSQLLSSSDSRLNINAAKVRETSDQSEQKLHWNGTESRIPPSEEVQEGLEVPKLDVSYLLISPVLGAIAGLATMFSAPSPEKEGDLKLATHPSLVVYGDRDAFTSQRKLRQWCEQMQQRATEARVSEFAFREVEGAGHFWREDGALVTLRQTVKKWVQKTVDRKSIQPTMSPQ